VASRSHLAALCVALSIAACSSEAGVCTNASDCLEGEICVGGQCQTIMPVACTRDEQCGTGKFCDADGQCKERTIADATPGQDVETVTDAKPFDALPVDLGVIDDAGSSADADEPDVPVAADAAADAGPRDAAPLDAVVQDAVAQDALPRDAAPRDAQPGDARPPDTGVVDAGTMPKNLPLNADCTLDAQCQSRLCLPFTIDGTSFSVCSEPCSAGSNCPLDFSCVALEGMSFCLGETVFNPTATFDVRAGGMCQSGSIRCQSGWCNTQAMSCIETCSREQDCSSFGGRCWTYTQSTPSGNVYDHLCLAQTGSAIGASCTSNANCSSGLCNRYTATCAAHCCADADCPAAQSCVVYDLDTQSNAIIKVCEPRTPGTGTLQLGATCTQPSSCESEVCAPRTVTSTSGPRQCSTLCCRHADCALIANGRCEPFAGPRVNNIDTIVGVCVSSQ
jgi:hypothetical protein